MIESLLLNWKLVLIAVLGVALVGMTDLYLGKRDELATFESRVVTLGDRAIAENARIAKEGEDNLSLIKEKHELEIPSIRAGAVANYVAHAAVVRKSASSSSAVPEAGAGLKLDDAGQRQCVPDEALIEAAAEDAERQAAWQEYCRLADCPVID